MATISHEETRRQLAREQEAIEKQLADADASEARQQSANISEAQQREAERRNNKIKLQRQLADNQRRIQEFNTEMEKIRQVQASLFSERDSVLARIRSIEDQYRGACSEFMRFQAMSEPFFNMNPAQTWARYGATPYPHVSLNEPINYVAARHPTF